MKKIVLNYNILIEKEIQPDGTYLFVTHVPSLGISDFGKTPDKAAKNTEGAIKIYLESVRDMGEPIPGHDHEEVYLTSRKIEIDTSIQSFVT